MRKLSYFLFFILTIGCSSDDGQPFNILINSGGPSFDYDGSTWEPDRDNNATSQYQNIIEIEGTENDQLYQTEVFATAGFSYQVPVPNNGPWTVVLHFAEIFHGVVNTNGIGARVFNVDIENGQGTLTNYDIIEASGAPATAIVESFSGIEVLDDTLSITLSTIVNAAKISGVEISGRN